MICQTWLSSLVSPHCLQICLVSCPSIRIFSSQCVAAGCETQKVLCMADGSSRNTPHAMQLHASNGHMRMAKSPGKSITHVHLTNSLSCQCLILYSWNAVLGINTKLLHTSPMGDYSGLLSAWHVLTSIKPITQALTKSPQWLGAASTANPDEGRRVLQTLLGPAFALTVLPDPQWTPATTPQPSIGQQCFSDAQNRRQGDLSASMTSLRFNINHIRDSLHAISMNFLRSQVHFSTCSTED